MNYSRREFIASATAAGAAVSISPAAFAAELDAKPMPTRVLGKTGAKVSTLALGGGSRFLSYKEEDKAIAAVHQALDRGITYLDTAFTYGNGVSETRVGKAIQGRRKGLFIATKMQERNGDKARAIVDGSLKRLGVDQVDLIHMHALMDEADLKRAEAPDGFLKVLKSLKEQKITRFIGVTCHHDPTVLKMALERHDFDVTQMALNAALTGMRSGQGGMVPNPDAPPSFESIALPVALRKKMGVIAMKVFAADALVGQVPVDKLLYYSMSLPVSMCVLGMPKLEFIDQNTRLAKAFKPMPKAEMKELSTALSAKNKAALDRYFQRHIDVCEA